MQECVYTGFHTIEEKIRQATELNIQADFCIYYTKVGPRIKNILSLAKSARIQCQNVSNEVLLEKVETLPQELRDHRGIVLVSKGTDSRSLNNIVLSDWLKVCPARATVLMLDAISDPHNIGAILRSCDQFGVDLVILPSHKSTANAAQNQTIAKTSAGASAWVPVATVTNLVRAAQELKQADFWLYAADAAGESLYNTTFDTRTCIIMGSEGSGISRLLSQQCDTVVSIPTCGKIDSLNVSVATGIILYERSRQNQVCGG